jgi:hypothetical protein
VTGRLSSLIFATAILAYACGPRPPAKETQARRTDSTPGSLESSFDISLGDGVRLDFRVTNGTSRAVELNFPSGRTHDFIVADTLGRELWKWSAGRLFTQVMQNRVLDRDETLSYDAEWMPGALHGTYVAVVSLNSTSHPIERRSRFTIP